MSDITARLQGVLERHVSQINSRVIMSRALKASGVEGPLREEQVRTVLANIERSLQVFAMPSVRARVMQELWGAVGGPPVTPTTSVAITSETDVGRARLLARSMCLDLGVRSFTLQSIATAVSELARNIVKYAGQGSVTLGVEEDPRRFVIVAEDSGPGIPNLDEILSGAYVSKTGMGLGILGTKRMVSHFEIESSPAGTRVRAEVKL